MSVQQTQTTTDVSGNDKISVIPPEWIFSRAGSLSNSNTGNASTSVKIATSNLFVFDEASVAIESMTDLIFEDIGGQELIDITRSDLAFDIQTQTAPNQPISNLSDISQKYSPKVLVGLQGTLNQHYNSYSINLDTHIPQVPEGPTIVYIDANGSLVIEVVNMDLDNNERVEVEFLSAEGTFSGII